MNFIKSIGACTSVLLALFVANTLSAQNLSGDTWASAQENGSASITAIYLQEDAFAYPDANGVPTGVEIDIFNQFSNWLKNSKKIMLDVNYVAEPSFQKFYSTVENGGDGLVGLGTVTILERRKREVQFTPPWINNIAVLVSHQSASDLNSLDNIAKSFAGMKAVVAKGTTLEGYMLQLKANYFPNVPVEYVSSQMEVVQKVASDPNYFAYMDLSIYWPAYDKEGMPIKRHEVGDLATETFGFILPLGSDWIEPLNEFFNLGSGYRSNPAYRNILLKHLGGEVTKMLQLAQTKSENR